MNFLIFVEVIWYINSINKGSMGVKNPEIWNSWSLSSGIQLHPLQVQIAMRGIGLLKVGGMMVYSTCSFNPVENEAVVASLLRRCSGTLELVDTSHMLPKLKRRPGLKTWKVAVEIKLPGAIKADGNKEKGITKLQWVDSFANYQKEVKRV